MKIDIEEVGGKIHAKVQVRPIHRKEHNVKIKILMGDILKYLSERNIKVGKCIQGPPFITNLMGPEERSGEWIFEKIKPLVKPKPVSQIKKQSPIKEKTSSNQKKIKKSEKNT